MADDNGEIEVEIVPSSGDPTKLKATGNSVAEVLQAAGRSPEKMNIIVIRADGTSRPATLDTHVASGDKIKLEERAAGS